MLRRLIGDRAGFSTFLGRLISGSIAVVTIPLVLMRLTPAEQGIYYIFLSLVALQSILELGFSTVAIQRVGHARGMERGVTSLGCKSAGLFRLVVRWYAWLALVVLVVLTLFGWCYFEIIMTDGALVAWRGPWLLVVISTALAVFGLGLGAGLEGQGRVVEMAHIRSLASIAKLIALAVTLAAGAGLWSAGIGALAAGMVLIVAPWIWLGDQIGHWWRMGVGSAVTWHRDVWPFQWRIAISWAAGFFIFQLMTLVVGANGGAVEAGRFGLGIQIVTAITTLAMSWTSTKQAIWADLVGRQDWTSLDRSFFSIVRLSTVLSLLGVLLAWAIIAAIAELPGQASIRDRLPDSATFAWLLSTAVINQIVFAMALYLRSHGREPFLIISVAFAVVMALVASVPMSPVSLASIYACITFGIGFLWGGVIFLRCRYCWHQVPFPTAPSGHPNAGS